jgi:histidine triad (HIT) family protein
MPPGMGQGDQCIFCQLVDNPDQLLLVGETDNFYAWLDINPRAKGHTMVVPKEHTESIMDLGPKEYQEAMNLTREVVEKSEKGIGAEGASITININETGGQMMPHAYIQVWPRFSEDENAGTPTGAIFPQREDLKQDLEEFQSKMSDVSVDFGVETIEPHPDSKKFKEEKLEAKSNSEKGQKAESSDAEDDKDDDIPEDIDSDSIEWV